jgi:hypothetical protein
VQSVARFLVKSHDRATTVMGCMNFHRMGGPTAEEIEQQVREQQAKELAEKATAAARTMRRS